MNSLSSLSEDQHLNIPHFPVLKKLQTRILMFLFRAINLMTDDYKNHPAFAGYVIRDEPDTGIFPRLAELRKLYLEKDPSHEPFINLFPSYADNKQLGARDFQDYLDKFIKFVGWNCAHNARYKNGEKVNGDSPAATPIGKDFDLVIGTFVKGDKRNLVIVNASYKKSADFSFSKAVKHKIIDTIDADFDNKKSAWKLHPGGCVILDCIN